MISEREIFCSALERTQTLERFAYLEQACRDRPATRARVEALLLAADRDDDILDHTEIDAPEKPGANIGPYRLREQLGEGGFGVVYLADQQSPVRREVALKIIKLGMDTRAVVARFEAERQALAWMDHPNIARVFDAGATATGRPYFVMERVHGEPITSFCNEARLDLRSRLRLFLQVCRAIQHAHQKGIIHRDLKPSNILVHAHEDLPTAKVIDFGIAKAMHAPLSSAPVFSHHYVFVGTPAYMSPEQVSSQPVDTRSDVYSLGVLLYQLLTDLLPIDTETLLAGGYGQVQRVVEETEPRPPSQRIAALSSVEQAAISSKRQYYPARLVDELRGDLDSIVLRCLEKSPARRYPSAEDLARDLENYLADQPVSARPATWHYRTQKFLRRHRRSISVIAAGASLLLVLGVYHGVRLTAERDRAQAEAKKAAKVSELLTEVLMASDPFRTPGSGGPLEASVERLRREFPHQADVRAEVLNAVGRIYLRRGQHEEAGSILHEAVAAARELPAPDLRLAEALTQSGVFQRERGNYVRAVEEFTEALQLRRQILGTDRNEVAIVMVELGRAYSALDRLDLAEPLFRESLEIRRRVLGPVHREVAVSLSDLASVLWQRGDLTGAEKYYLLNLAMNRETVGLEHPNYASSLANMAMLRLEQGRLAEAETLLRESRGIMQRAFGPGHWRTARVLGQLGAVELQQGHVEQAARDLTEALAGAKSTLGPDNTTVARLAIERARVHLAQHEWRTAESLLRESLAVQRRWYAENSWRIAEVESLLGAVLLETNRLDEAETLLRSASLVLKPVAGPQGRETKLNAERLALVLEKRRVH